MVSIVYFHFCTWQRDNGSNLRKDRIILSDPPWGNAVSQCRIQGQEDDKSMHKNVKIDNRKNLQLRIDKKGSAMWMD